MLPSSRYQFFSLSFFILFLRLHLTCIAISVSLPIHISMSEADGETEHSTRPVLPVYRHDGGMVEQAGLRRLRDEGALERDVVSYVFVTWRFLVVILMELMSSTFPDQRPAATSGLLRRCYRSVRTLIAFRGRRQEWDVEAAVIDGCRSPGGAVVEPRLSVSRAARDVHGVESRSDVKREESRHSAGIRSSQRDLVASSISNHSGPRLLSDEENARMNRKVDRLVAAVEDCRPIHFAPDARTGEVEIFADPHGADDMIDQGEEDQLVEDQLERDISASPGSSGRVIRPGDGVRRIRSLSSLRHADSTGSWASTDSEASSSNAWERAVAAANERFALEYGVRGHVDTAVVPRSRGMNVDIEARQGRYVNRLVSPIVLDFDKLLRRSTPSIHSNGTEMDTSSPLFRKSCQRILQESYAEAPGLVVQPKSRENSLPDEWAFVSEPRDATSPRMDVPDAASSTGRVLGVFRDDVNEESSSKKAGKSALRSKVLKDISNLRRPGYLQFNSFAKDTKATATKASTAAPTAAPSTSFEGAATSEARRAYIKEKWPALSADRSNSSMEAPPRLDGAARRRNEQAIGRPVDESLYSLSGADSTVADVPLDDAKARRQTHFDLALARLEGRALPPSPSLSPSPIHRYPDWAALYDLDVHVEGGHRPLRLREPMPSRSVYPTPREGLWRFLR